MPSKLQVWISGFKNKSLSCKNPSFKAEGIAEFHFIDHEKKFLSWSIYPLIIPIYIPMKSFCPFEHIMIKSIMDTYSLTKRSTPVAPLLKL